MKYSGVGNSSNHNNPSTLFCEQVSTVTSLFEKWNECERTVVMYALLKRLRYPTIKFLQCSIENNIINNQQINLITRQQYLKTDLNANDINYLQKLLSAYKIDDNNSNNNCNFNNYTNNIITPPLNDKDSILLYESDSSNSTSNSSTISSANKQIISSNNNIATIQSTAATQLQQHGNILINRNGKIYNKKEEILRDILTMLPLLKPGNDEIKNIYLSIIPLAVEDTVRQIVSTDLVQQIFSYLLIHPAISNEDRRSLSTWLKHLEDHIQSLYSGERSFYILTNNNSNTDTSLSKSSSMTSSLGGGFGSGSGVGIINNNNNSINKNTWQAIAPPSSQQQLNFQNRRFQQQQTTNSIFSGSSGDNGSSGSSTLSGGGSSITSTSIYSGSSSEWNMNLSQLTDNICDNFQRGNVKLPITKNLTTKSNQNNSCLGLIYDGVVNPVNNCSTSTGSGGGGGGGSSSGSSSNLNLSLNHNDDHHVSFSKNGTEIIDFDDINQSCDKCNTQIVGYNSVMLCCCDHQQNLQQQKNNLLIGTASSSSSSTNTINNNYSPVTPTLSAAAALIAVPHQSELPRWNLDVGGKISSIIKTRRSNSLTTPAIISSSTTSSSSSSSTSSVITVNDNCSSNSSENLSQYAQKPRSYSLSIEHPRGALSSSGSDTRLDDMKQQPTNYMKFQTHNIGMSNIGQWLKSLRLHKYIGLFATITYENMLEITEEYLQSLGVTKGASHKLALCIDKLKDRYYHLIKLEQDLLSGQITLTAIIEELTNIVLTPMRPVDSSPNNVAYKFLQVLELVSSNVIQKEVNTIQDEDCVNALLWILERSIHAEAFMTHTNQLKEQKFKLSKLKAQFSPKIHPQHNKNGSNGSLNKPRWTKSRNKNDNTKTGSIDRINNRKNSHDIVSFSLNTLQQNNSNSAGGVGGNIASTIHNLSNNNLHDIEKYHQLHKNQSTTASNSLVGSSTKMSSTSSTSTTQQQQQHFKLNSNNISSSSSNNSNESSSNLSCPQYKSSSYPNFSNTCGGGSNSCGQITNQQEQHQQQHQQQQQIQQHHQLQHQYNQQQYRHRHSLNNLIVVSSNPQQPQQMIFKQGKGGFSKIDSTIISSGGGDNISGGKNHRRSSITNSNCSGSAGVLQSNISTTVQQSSNLDNSNNVGNNSHLKPNKNTEKTFAEIISVSNNNNNNNINNNGSNYNNSINNIKSSSLLNCENIINVIGGGDGSNSINCSSSNNGGDNNIIIDNNCCNSGLITTTTATTNSQSINNTTNSNLLNQNNSNDIQKISKNNLNDINRSLEQLEFLCLQMTEQAIN